MPFEAIDWRDAKITENLRGARSEVQAYGAISAGWA